MPAPTTLKIPRGEPFNTSSHIIIAYNKSEACHPRLKFKLNNATEKAVVDVLSDPQLLL